MAYQESDFQTEFGKWIQKPEQVDYFGTANFELKCLKKKSINIRTDFKDHQLPELWHSKNKHAYQKHSDQSFVKKNWDCSLWVGTPAYVVVLFYVPRKPKRFHVIDIDDFLELDKKVEKDYIKEYEIETKSEVFIL